MLRSAVLTLTLAPLLALLATVLLPLAFATTTFAFLALAARVSVVYLELFAALLLHHLRHLAPPARESASSSSAASVCPIETALLRRSHSTRSHASSADGAAGSPTLPHNVYAAPAAGPALLSRDFEGIGGWRDDEGGADPARERQWLAVGARLELPAAAPPPPVEERARRHHQRSRTAGSARPERWSLPVAAGASGEGEAGPEVMGGAEGGSRAKSMIVLAEAGMNIGRTRSKRRRGSKSSGSSSNSGNSGALLMAHEKVE